MNLKRISLRAALAALTVTGSYGLNQLGALPDKPRVVWSITTAAALTGFLLIISLLKVAFHGGRGAENTAKSRKATLLWSGIAVILLGALHLMGGAFLPRADIRMLALTVGGLLQLVGALIIKSGIRRNRSFPNECLEALTHELGNLLPAKRTHIQRLLSKRNVTKACRASASAAHVAAIEKRRAEIVAQLEEQFPGAAEYFAQVLSAESLAEESAPAPPTRRSTLVRIGLSKLRWPSCLSFGEFHKNSTALLVIWVILWAWICLSGTDLTGFAMIYSMFAAVASPVVLLVLSLATAVSHLAGQTRLRDLFVALTICACGMNFILWATMWMCVAPVLNQEMPPFGHAGVLMALSLKAAGMLLSIFGGALIWRFTTTQPDRSTVGITLAEGEAIVQPNKPSPNTAPLQQT